VKRTRFVVGETATPRFVLDDDGLCCVCCGPPPEPGVVPPVYGQATATLQKRTRTGWSEDGNPVLEWQTLATAAAVVIEERAEFDPDAGFTRVVAKMSFPYEGPEIVRETAQVKADDGRWWRVVSADQYPGRVELGLVRIDQTPGEAEAGL
jgi:hypothetical protein